MKMNTSKKLRAGLAKMIVAMLLVAVVALIPTYTAQAAKAPTVSKKSLNVMVKETYDLNIKNKIAGSTYEWVSSDVKIATVDAKGLVRGKSRGNVVITCKITAADKKVYTVSSKVKVVSGAKGFAINNKIATLNKDQVYDVNRTLQPFTSNDVTTWTSSDTTIAKPDKNGKFTALKTGTVTITGTTLSGKTDSMTVMIVDADGAVATQAELETLLKNGATKITLRTDKEIVFTIPEGKYEKTTLIVDAPKADVYNSGVFKSIEILQIAPSTFHEKAKGNKLVIKSANASIEVAENASVEIEVTTEGAKVTIKNDAGVVTGIVMMSSADLKIEGKSKTAIPVSIKAAGVSITTSVPMAVTATAPANLTLEKGAESSTIAVDKKENLPVISGDVTISVAVGTGSTQTKVEVKGKEIVVDKPATPSVPTPGGSGGSGGSGGDSGTTAKDVTRVKVGNSVQYILSKPVSQIATIKVTYSSIPYEVDTEMMTKLIGFLNDPTGSIDRWKTMGAVTRTYGAGAQVTIEASAATNNGTTRTITFVDSPLGLLDGNQYTAVLGSVTGGNGSFTLTSVQSGKSFTISKMSDYVLQIDSDIEGLEFTPKFK